MKKAILFTKHDYRYKIKGVDTTTRLLSRYSRDLTRLFSFLRSRYMGTIPHLGISIVANELKKHGMDVEVKDLYNTNAIKKANSFDLIGISFMDISFDYVMSVLPDLDLRKTVLGGIGASVLEQKVREEFPEVSVVLGESEGLMAEIVKDVESGKLKPRYKREQPVNLSDAREVDLSYKEFKLFKRSFLQILEIGRGCNQHCQFCITPKSNPNISYKPLEIVEEELKSTNTGFYRPLFLIDQNLFAYPEEYVLDLFRMINKEEHFWIGQGTIQNVIHNEQILREMSKGCLELLVGIEDVTNNKIKGAKDKNSLKNHLEESVAKLRHYRIPIVYSIVFGLDEQEYPDIFIDTAERVNELGLTVLPHIATPRTGTDWNTALERDVRIVDWNYGHRDQKLHCVYQPKHMSHKELLAGFSWFYQQVFSGNKIMRRTYKNLRECGIKYVYGLAPIEADAFLTRNVLKSRYGKLINHTHFQR